MEFFTSYFLARLNEPSSWRGLVGIATAAGLVMSPEQTNAIVSLGMAIIGAVGVFTPDAKK